MGIDRRRVKDLAARAEPEPVPEPEARAGRDEVTKRLSHVRNLLVRMQAGEDVEATWPKVNRELRHLIRAAGKVTRRTNNVVERRSYRNGYRHRLEPRSLNPENLAVTREIEDLMLVSRNLATALGHPRDADLEDTEARNVIFITQGSDGRWYVMVDGAPVANYTTDQEAADHAVRLEGEALGKLTTGKRWGRMTRWAKIREVIDLWT